MTNVRKSVQGGYVTPLYDRDRCRQSQPSTTANADLKYSR